MKRLSIERLSPPLPPTHSSAEGSQLLCHPLLQSLSPNLPLTLMANPALADLTCLPRQLTSCPAGVLAHLASMMLLLLLWFFTLTGCSLSCLHHWLLPPTLPTLVTGCSHHWLLPSMLLGHWLHPPPKPPLRAGRKESWSSLVGTEGFQDAMFL